jgi:dTMP kinase
MVSSNETMKELRKRMTELKATRAAGKQSIRVVTDIENEEEHQIINTEQKRSPTASPVNQNPALDEFLEVERASTISTSSVEQELSAEKARLLHENIKVRLELERAKKENEDMMAARSKTVNELRVRLEAAERKLSEEQLQRMHSEQEQEKLAAERAQAILAQKESEERAARAEAIAAEARAAEARALAAAATASTPPPPAQAPAAPKQKRRDRYLIFVD